MEQIEAYILNNDSEYAIFINGAWGKGKTYYIHNDLVNWLKSKCPERKLYYFSVNGIKNNEELHRIIISETLKTVTRHKTEKFRSELDKRSRNKRYSGYLDKSGKKISKILDEITIVGKAKNVLNFKDIIDPNSALVILDDLERLSPNFAYEELFGYINSEFIEHGGYKLILIGDESKIDATNSKFSEIKEKYIRWSYEYRNNIEDILTNIFNIYEANSRYHAHLNQYKDFISILLKQFSIENIRTVKYFLEVYSNIYDQTLEKHNYLLKDIIYFSLIICFESKNGSFDIFAEVKHLPYSVFPREGGMASIYSRKTNSFEEGKVYKTDNPDKEDKIEAKFHTYIKNGLTFYSDNNLAYQFFESVYNYVKTGILDTSHLKKELEDYSNLKKPIVVFESNKYIDSIGRFRSLKQEDLDQSLDLLKSDIQKGNLDLGEFIRAGKFLIFLAQEELISDTPNQINNLLESNIENVDLEKNIRDLSHHLDFDIEKIKVNHPGIAQNIEVKLKKVSQLLRIKQTKDNLQDWRPKDKGSKFILGEFIECLNPKEIGDSIFARNGDREFLDGANRAIRDFYKITNVGSRYKHHITRLTEIKTNLESRLSEISDKIDLWYMRGVIASIEKSMNQIYKTIPQQESDHEEE